MTDILPTIHNNRFLDLVVQATYLIDMEVMDKLVHELAFVRVNGGRLFIIGVGGGAANASHAACDFRKLCGIEAYAPTDNVAELTAHANDEGWDTIFVNWLRFSRLNKQDAILVFSVGGGSDDPEVSVNIVQAVHLAKDRGAKVLGIVGRSEGVTARVGDVVLVVPTVDDTFLTPITEAFQAIIWHCLVSHPSLKLFDTKW